MATLSAHLRRSEDHGCLPFHPDCPICRDERLSGTLPVHGLVSRRTQAVMVAGMLAASTATPTVAVAQEGDQVSEGAAEPEQSGSGATTDFDPGGESDGLPFEGPEVPDTEAAPETADPGALEPEPVTDLDAPVADAGDEPAPVAAPAPTPAPVVTPPSTAPVVTPPSTAPVVTPPSTAAPAPAPPQQVAVHSLPGAAAVDHELVATVNGERAPRAQPNAPAAPGPATSAPASAPTASAPPVVHLVSAAPAPKPQHEAATSGDRYHVVAAGESLWSISRHALGGSASPAKIAREVNRLWGLNSARIATGDPDLLRVGTKLVLR